MAADLEYEDPDNVPSVTARVSHSHFCLFEKSPQE